MTIRKGKKREKDLGKEIGPKIKSRREITFFTVRRKRVAVLIRLFAVDSSFLIASTVHKHPVRRMCSDNADVTTLLLHAA